jgi:hypothetical protein
VDDPLYHEDNLPDTHDIGCDTCDNDEYRAEGWDLAYEYYSDMLAMPHPNNNPYRG